MTEVFSVTGEPIDLKLATDESLAEVIENLDAEISVLYERRRFVARELAKRADGKSRMLLHAFTVSVEPRVNVSRRSQA